VAVGVGVEEAGRVLMEVEAVAAVEAAAAAVLQEEVATVEVEAVETWALGTRSIK
jgi:hypothetical protein